MMKYLYIPKFPEDEENFNKVCEQFTKKAFCSDSLLIIIVETLTEFYKYVYPVMGKASKLGGFCKYEGYLSELGVNGYPFACIKLNELRYGEPNYEKLLSEVDCYISGSSNSKELPLMELAFDMDKNILSCYSKDVFADMPQLEEKVKLKNDIANEVKKIFTDYPAEKYEYILYSLGLGETAAFFYMLKDYKKSFQKKLLVICREESRKSFLEESPYIDSCIKVSELTYAYISIFYSNEYKIKNFLLTYIQEKAVRERWLPPNENKYTPYLFPMKIMCNFKDDYKFEKYPVKISNQKRQHAEELFKKLNLKKGKSVFLIADGVNGGDYSKYNENFWNELVQAIKKSGYEVVTKGESELIQGCKYVFLPPWESSIFAGLCGNVISIPTGISYLIGTVNTNDNINLQIMYMNSKKIPAWRTNFNNWYDHVLPNIRNFGLNGWFNGMVEQQRKDTDIMFGKNIDHTNVCFECFDKTTIEKLIKNLLK